jgi:malic enzyme
MSRIRTLFISILISGVVSAGMAFVPTIAAAQSRDQTPTMTDKAKSTADDVSKWTQKQWNAAKAKWVKEKDKWKSCNKQATDKKLSGRNSWSFIYTCMTT